MTQMTATPVAILKTALGAYVDIFGNPVTVGTINPASFSPANPTATASTTAVMMGLGTTITVTPKSTGRLNIYLGGLIGNTTTADGASAQLATGTGTAPANGAAATGTLAGTIQTWTSLTGVLTATFACQALVTGLTLNVAVWVDLQLKAVTGGSASVTGLTAIVTET